MPDGDVLRLKIPPYFVNTYRQLCEGVASPSDLAHQLGKSLCKQLNWYGPGPRQLLSKWATHVEQFINQNATLSTDQLIQLDNLISHERRYVSGRIEGLNIVVQICRAFLVKVEGGLIIEDPASELASLFVMTTLDVALDSRLVAIPNHLDNVPTDVVQERRYSINDEAQPYINSIIKQIANKPSNVKLRLPSIRKQRRELTPNDEVV